MIEIAHDHNKYCIIFDKNENANVFFEYKATLRDIHKESIAVQLGRKTRDEALDVLRSALVYSMRIGDTFCINMDNLVMDFKDRWQDDQIFPLDKIVNFDQWRKYQNYMKVVKTEENHDLLGNKNCYCMNDNFTMVFLSKYTTDANIIKVLDSIPNSDSMDLIIIEKQKTELDEEEPNHQNDV